MPTCSQVFMVRVLVWHTYISYIFNVHDYIRHRYLGISEDFKVHSVFIKRNLDIHQQKYLSFHSSVEIAIK